MFKRFKGHYSQQKKKSERDVISYEDMPLDDYEQEKTDISPEAVKKIIVGVCIAIVAGLVVFAFANREKLTWDNISTWWTYDVLGNAGNGYPVNLVGTEVASGNFSVNQGRIAYASDTSFITLNSTGSEVANFQLRYSRPIMKSADNKFLTFGIGGTGYQIQSFDKKLYTGDAEASIYTGDISSNGVYCLVTEGNGFHSSLYAYSSNNNRIYKYSFSEYYINCVALNSDGSGCIATGITTTDGAVKTCVYLLDFSKEEPVYKYILEDDAIIDGKYISDSRVALVGQFSAYVINTKSEEYKTIHYNEKNLANYCFNRDTKSFVLALSRSGDDRSCNLEVFNDNGENTQTIETDYGVDSISQYKGTIAILDGNTAYVYDNSGNCIFSRGTDAGSKRLILTSDTTGYVLSVNQVRFIDFKRESTTDFAR